MMSIIDLLKRVFFFLQISSIYMHQTYYALNLILVFVVTLLNLELKVIW